MVTIGSVLASGYRCGPSEVVVLAGLYAGREWLPSLVRERRTHVAATKADTVSGHGVLL